MYQMRRKIPPEKRKIKMKKKKIKKQPEEKVETELTSTDLLALAKVKK